MHFFIQCLLKQQEMKQKYIWLTVLKVSQFLLLTLHGCIIIQTRLLHLCSLSLNGQKVSLVDELNDTLLNSH